MGQDRFHDVRVVTPCPTGSGRSAATCRTITRSATSSWRSFSPCRLGFRRRRRCDELAIRSHQIDDRAVVHRVVVRNPDVGHGGFAAVRPRLIGLDPATGRRGLAPAVRRWDRAPGPEPLSRRFMSLPVRRRLFWAAATHRHAMHIHPPMLPWSMPGMGAPAFPLTPWW